MVLHKVSVIISVYSKDRLEYLLDCLDSLRRQSFKPFEVIVVLDPLQDIVDFYKSRLDSDVKIIVSNGSGLSNARNAGVKNAEGDVVAFIDDDAVADRDWLKNLMKNYWSPYVAGVGGSIRPLWENGRPIWFPEELDWVVGCSYKGLPEGKAFVRNIIGCNMSFQRWIFEKFGYFRVDVGRFGKLLLGSEETELCIRVQSENPMLKFVYDPSAVVYHRVIHERASFKHLLRRSWGEGLSKALITNSRWNPSTTLSTESWYLKYMARVAIPSRLKRIHKIENILHMYSMLISSFTVGVGFLVGKIVRLLR